LDAFHGSVPPLLGSHLVAKLEVVAATRSRTQPRILSGLPVTWPQGKRMTIRQDLLPWSSIFCRFM
jgi:hypothetical protein